MEFGRDMFTNCPYRSNQEERTGEGRTWDHLGDGPDPSSEKRRTKRMYKKRRRQGDER
jgi:hypothetical protein